MLVEKNIHIDWCDTDLVATPNGVDIWEQDGHYYFTWEAGMREAEAQGLRLPTKEEWEQSFEIIGNSKLFNFLKLNYGGFYYSVGQYYTQGLYGYYWSSTPSSYFSYHANFYSGGVNIMTTANREFGFSARCIKN